MKLKTFKSKLAKTIKDLEQEKRDYAPRSSARGRTSWIITYLKEIQMDASKLEEVA